MKRWWQSLKATGRKLLLRALEAVQRRVAEAPATPPLPPAPGCSACTNDHDRIGSSDGIVRVLAFGGGGYDALMQLGVIHALVVSDAAPPDIVAGLSAGAVNAAALAETLKADETLRANGEDAAVCRDARMSRFREFLYEAQDTPSRLRELLLPDMYEADAGMALEPHRFVTDHEDERKARREGLRTRSGLVDLMNAIGRLRISVATVTRYTRCIFGLRAAGSRPFRDRWKERTRELWRMLRTVAAHSISTAQALLFFARPVFGHRRRRHGYPAGKIIFRPTRRYRLAQLLAAMAVVAGAFRALEHPLAQWLLLPPMPGAVAFAIEVVALSLAALTIYFVVPAAIYLLLTFLTLLLLFPWRRLRKHILRNARSRFLAHYDLLHDLGGTYFVRDALIRLFNPAYYGERSIRASARLAFRRRRVKAASATKPKAATQPRTFADYSVTEPKIHVMPVAADLASGALAAIPASTPIVDGLTAAVARTPFVRPVKIGDTYYIDGETLAGEPTMTVREVLRERLHPEARAVHLYTVSSLPVENQKLGPATRPRYTGLVDVLLRVRKLQRFRTTKLDRNLTGLYDNALPPQRVGPERIRDNATRALKCFGNGDHAVRTRLIPIEPDEQALSVGTDLLRARTRLDQQTTIARTVATGCRLTLETIVGGDASGVVRCADAIAARRGTPLSAGVPGANEICSQCTLAADAAEHAQSLRMRVTDDGAPRWPATGASQSQPTPPAAHVIEEGTEVIAPDDPIRPATVNLLFSGGVFRGVFLVGVLNALQLLRVKPQLVAGSSVGSITAAMAARLFSLPPREQQVHLGYVASTYLSLDDYIVTDRFADFVRRLTLRAAATKFSLADIDEVLRNYDRPSNRRYLKSTRRLLAGMEHLLYVSPFELIALVRSLRLRDTRNASRLVRRYFQEVLDRGGVAMEVLGTEPLSFLIRQHVIPDLGAERTVPLESFHPTRFLVTATNLTVGELQILGGSDSTAATLVDALLASSAFPGVFRPRWGWEVFVDGHVEDQFVDGGVMDNLPLDAVVDYLSREAAAKREALRPANDVPHLIFTASLERDPRQLAPDDVRKVAESWPATMQHARELRYNRKIDSFATAQRDFRKIYRAYRDSLVPLPRVPLDLEVMAVKPRWLCDTFGFHPMLGFRQDRQAASIAHGCASALATIANFETSSSDSKRWLDDWHFADDVRTTLEHTSLGTLTPRRRTDGTCHFRSEGLCPFSMAGSDDVDSPVKVDVEVRSELATIYELCGKTATHRATA